MSTAVYWPASFVVRSFERFVSRFVTVTLAFATAAPEGSVTVPTKVASCAKAGTANTARKRTKSDRAAKRLSLRVRRLSTNSGERDFICQPPKGMQYLGRYEHGRPGP